METRNNELNNEIGRLQVNIQKEIEKKNKDEREQIEYLRLLLNYNEQKKLNLYDKERQSYTQECVYELLNNNVTTSRVSPVIKAVLNL